MHGISRLADVNVAGVGPASNVFVCLSVWQVATVTHSSLRCSGTGRHVFWEPPCRSLGDAGRQKKVSVTAGTAKGFCLLRSVGTTEPKRGKVAGAVKLIMNFHPVPMAPY
jgi:hypothetical protein